MEEDAIVEAAGLRREFGGTPAVRAVSLAVPRGAVLALVGPNGAGKTTLLRMIAGLLAPSSGRLRVDGWDARVFPREVHARLGYLPDSFALYDELRVRETLEYFALCHRIPAAGIRARVAELLALVRLSERADDRVGSLSRGMRQRVAMARALVHDPAVLLLDEPASGLDPDARRCLQDIFARLAACGKTLIVSSHILTELEEYCTHVAFLERGTLAFFGPVEEARRALTPRRRVRARVHAGAEAALGVLEADPRAADAARRGSRLEFAYDGGPAELAGLLGRLVRAGAEISSYETGGGIEDAYLSWLRGRSGS